MIDQKTLAEKQSKASIYKKTQLGLIPKDWDIVSLNMLVDPKRSIRYGIVQPGDFDSKGRFMIRGQDYSFGWVAPEEFFRVSDSVETKYKNARVKAGDILLTIVGAGTGNVATVPEWLEGANITQTTARISINEKEACAKYCFYYLQSFRGQRLTYKNIKGGAQPGLNCTDIAKYPILVPPIYEQQKIADILLVWDKAIDKTQKLIAQIKLRNKGIAQQLLTGKKRLKGFAGEWRKVKFSDIAERVKRKNEELNDTVVTISAQRGFVLQEEFFSKRIASEILSNYYLIHRGEFAYNKSYSNGYPMGAFKRLDSHEKAVVTTLYICFKLTEEVDPDFMVYFFEAGLLIQDLMEIAQEGGRAHGLLNISLPDFFGMHLKLPDKPEQIQISRVLATASREFEMLEKQLCKLKEQKKGLMQKLLTGEIRVNSVERYHPQKQ